MVSVWMRRSGMLAMTRVNSAVLHGEVITVFVELKAPEANHRPDHRQHSDDEDESNESRRQHRDMADRRHTTAKDCADCLTDDAARRHLVSNQHVGCSVEEPDLGQETECGADDDESAAVDETGE